MARPDWKTYLSGLKNRCDSLSSKIVLALTINMGSISRKMELFQKQDIEPKLQTKLNYLSTRLTAN